MLILTWLHGDTHACKHTIAQLAAYLAVTLADQLGGLTGIAGLQLTSGHDNGADAQLLVGQRALQCKHRTLRIRYIPRRCNTFKMFWVHQLTGYTKQIFR